MAMQQYSSNFHFGGGGGLGAALIKNPLDEQMAAHDENTKAYTDKLKSIYDGYSQYAKEYGDKAQPIMDALNGDIKGMEGYIGDYGKTLEDIKPTMMYGINVDPSATRTREEYQGNVAAAYGKSREQQAQQMTSQGMNPYANSGASRATNLSEAAGRADAGNKAYKDWRTQYNQDVQAKQAGMANYAGLQAKQGDMQGNVMATRNGLIDAQGKIMAAKMGADQAKATGYEGLGSLEEARRAETLGLAQQKQANSRTDQDIFQQMTAKKPPTTVATRDAAGNTWGSIKDTSAEDTAKVMNM